MDSICKNSHNFQFFLIALETCIIILYGIFVSFSDFSKPKHLQDSDSHSHFTLLYPLYQDIAIMIFVGIGFLMSFLRYHSWSSIGFNFVIGAIVTQLYVLCKGFWVRAITDENWDKNIELDIDLLIAAMFGAGAVLISTGAVIGKLNLYQLLVMATIEICVFSLNEAILFEKLKITDIGGSITVHIFGGYFGLCVSLIISTKECKDHPKFASDYNSNIVAFIGTLFLWVYWPSFNAAPGKNVNDVHRAALNTILSLTGSCISTFCSSAFFRNGRFSIDDILNATLAGGVIMGTSADIIVNPFSALIIGCFAGFISTFGFEIVSPFLQKKGWLYDTCGIHNLHAIPGLFGGVFSAVFIAGLTEDTLGYRIEDRFSNFSASKQAALQIAGCGVSLGFAIITGMMTGILLKLPCFNAPNLLFDDEAFWVIEAKPEDDLGIGHARKRTEDTELNRHNAR